MWNLRFYASESGREPVREFVEKDLDDDQRARLRERLRLLREWGPQMAEEYPRALQRLRGREYRCLYEIRIAKDQLRIFLFFRKEVAILTHAVQKAGKGKKKMRSQYDTALKRRNDWLERNE